MRQKHSIFSLVPKYKGMIAGLLFMAIFGKGLSLLLPKIIASGIDAYTQNKFDAMAVTAPFLAISIVILISDYALGILQTYASERVAKDLRQNVADKISRQSYSFIQKSTAGKLLTNLTSDIDAVKIFISQGIIVLVSSLFIIMGASAMLLITNLKLGLTVLTIIPIMGLMFVGIFSKVGILFRKSQQIIDRLNKIINESILGSTIIRVLHGQSEEQAKFKEINTEAKENGLKILRVFSSMIPLITFVSSLATLIVLAYGGHLTITKEMTIGQLAAFNSYISILVFPMLMLGFISNMIARSSASYARVIEVQDTPEIKANGNHTAKLRGQIDLHDVSISFGDHPILKHISFSIPAQTRTAILGPTAAGKTQLLNVLTGLTTPDSGQVLYDGTLVTDFDGENLHAQIGMVFQDSIVFNLSIRENIAFGRDIKSKDLAKALQTAELDDFINELPNGMDTLVSERGTTLSGGQKQRLMLARALAINPKILLLDDFTARVDNATEHRILKNIRDNYPNITLVSVTQKIASIEDYDLIILLMEGEILAQGTHAELMKNSPEYVQIYQSQRSTNQYER